MNGRSHYDVLGLAPTASSAEIREAYRRLAREFHPDRVAGSAVGGDRMPQINEAYRVLSDPGRRAVYDADGRAAVAPGNGAAPTEPAEEAPDFRFQYPDGPARVPWRSLLFFTAIAIAGVVVLAQFTKPAGPPEPDNILRTGDCVEIQPNNDAREVVCEGEGDLVVRQFIAFDRVCSNGWSPHRDRQGMGVVCVEERP